MPEIDPANVKIIIKDWKETEIIDPKTGEFEICTISQTNQPPAFHVFHGQLGYIGGVRPSPDNDTSITPEEIAASVNQGRVWRRIEDLPLRGKDETSDEEKQSKNFACCYKILQMVGELHARGYQRLRVFPYAKLMWWRCELAPAELFDPLNDTCMEIKPEYERAGLVARASSGDCSHPFGWKQNISQIPLQHLADLFLESFPAIARGSNGRDLPYAEWYQDMLKRTSPDVLPIAYYNDYGDQAMYDPMRLASQGGGGREGTMPLPPVYSTRTAANSSSDDRVKLNPHPSSDLFG